MREERERLSVQRKTGSGTVATEEERNKSLSIPSSTHELSIFLSCFSFGVVTVK